MKDFSILLTSPELAKYVRFEITGENLLEIAALLAKSVQPNEDSEEFLSRDEVLKLVGNVSRTTLWRWNKIKVLRHNQIGLYKKSDVIKFLEKK